MNAELIEKNLKYNQDLQEIAKMIFHAFYYDEDKSLSYPPDSNQYEKDNIEEILPKAEKIYRFFSSADDAKKTLRFLHEVSPIKGLEIINSL
jgi:hypothetical protein